jgi:hypothetical protein
MWIHLWFHLQRAFEPLRNEERLLKQSPASDYTGMIATGVYRYELSARDGQ